MPTSTRDIPSVLTNLHTMPFNKAGEPYKVVGHEFDLERDIKGDQKVDVLGHLSSGRSYRIRTFVLPTRENKLFMLAHEAAHCVGLSDGYSLFRRHPRLVRVRLTQEDSPEYAGKDAVTARSVLVEFGSLVTVGGRRVADDYWENESQQKYQYGELADPQDRLPPPGEPYNVEQWASASTERPLPPAQHQETWLADHAYSVSRYNSFLNRQRAKLWQSKGVYEGHTGLSFYAKDTQPSNPRWSWTQKKNKRGKIVVTTVISSDHRIAKTGLASVDPKVYANVDEVTRKAIQEQIEQERRSSVI